jgi:serine/threonine-protein kinase
MALADDSIGPDSIKELARLAVMPLDEPLIGDTKFDTVGPDATVESLSARSVIGGYHVLEEIGRGGMGVVYRAFDAELKRHVALKVLTGGTKASVDALVRFRGEAELVAKLQHPHIVQIYDSGEHDGQQFLVLELVDGGSLEKHIAGKPQDARDAAATIETLARAVEVAHQEGIIHRDLKPANVLRSRSGSLKITDFGLAKQLDHSLGFSRTGDLRGTPQYMAPEQAARDGGSVSPATDVYALGAMLYEMLTGRPPFVANNLLDILDQIIAAEPASPSQLVPRLPRDLCTICLKCLEKDPKRRYPTAAALADDLHRWLDGQPIMARPLNKLERGLRWLRRHPMGASLTVASGVAVAALTLYGFAVQERHHHEQQAEEAEKHRLQSEALFTRAVDAVDGFYKDVIASDPQLSRKKELLRSLIQRYQSLVALQRETQSQNRDQLAQSLAHLGKLLDTIGNKYDALDAYYKAFELRNEDVGASTAPAARHAMAQLYLALGNIHGDTGDRAQADEYLRLATNELQSLINRDAKNVAYRQDIAETWHSRGALYMFWKGSAAAFDPLDKGRELNEQLHRELPNDPSIQRGLARSYGYLGDIQLDLGRTADAEGSYKRSQDLRRRLAEEPGAALESRFQYARSYRNFGNLFAQARNYEKAEEAYGTALAIQEEIIKLDKSVADYQFDRTNSLCRIAELKIMAGDNAKAAEMANLAVSVARPLEDAGLRSTAMGGGLADALLHAVIAVIDDGSQDVSWSLNEVIEASPTDSPDPNSAYVFAAARALIGERSDISDEDRRLWREGAIAKLREAIEKGYRRKHPDDLKRDRAFRSLDDNDEFKNLMADYAAPPSIRKN